MSLCFKNPLYKHQFPYNWIKLQGLEPRRRYNNKVSIYLAVVLIFAEFELDEDDEVGDDEARGRERGLRVQWDQVLGLDGLAGPEPLHQDE